MKTEIALPLYLYIIHSESDIEDIVFQRRNQKRQQSNQAGFLFFPVLGQNVNSIGIVSFFARNQGEENKFLLTWAESEFYKGSVAPNKIFYLVENLEELKEIFNCQTQLNCKILIRPKDIYSLKKCADYVFKINNESIKTRISWWPSSTTSSNISNDTLKTVTKDYYNLLRQGSLNRDPAIPFFNSQIPNHFELEPLLDIKWEIFAEEKTAPILSIIIPTFNNSIFLSNLVSHFMHQDAESQLFELIIIDDGSTDGTEQIILKYLATQSAKINLKYIFWSKENENRGPQNFFRPGQARNSGAAKAKGQFLFFLDSDMLVPKNFIRLVLSEFESNDLIQFQRVHINEQMSQLNPKYDHVDLKKHCYIEEKNYWNQLFLAKDWNQLPQKWKYVCTYALGVKKVDFFEQGRIQRHFISYGFEDTDLGFRFHKKNKKFKLIQVPLLHLTNYSQLQYQNSWYKRRELLSKTAKIFFLDYLDLEIGTTLETFLGNERSLLDSLKLKLFSPGE